MKIFVTAAVILLLLVGGITANTLFLADRLDTLIDTVLRLPDAASDENTPYREAAEEVSSQWEQLKPITALTVSGTRVENIDRAINNIKIGWDEADGAVYREARAELLLLLRRLRAMESLSLDSIL